MTQAPHEIRRPGRSPDDEAARLYAEFGDRIYRFCLGRLRSREEAEDAVQNTFLRVCTALRKGVVPEFEGPWLYKIAHNVCLSRRLGSSRRAKVETPADLDLLGDRAAAHTADADELFGLDEALADMPANLRRPLLMREWQGMSYAEIAEAIGVSHSAVETLIFRARRHLAQALTDKVKRTGRAVASVFNLRWLFDLVKGLGGGAGSAGMAAGVAGLVVAIGGGVALELATQHASASRAAIAPAASAAPDSAPRASLPSGKTARGVNSSQTARFRHAAGTGNGSVAAKAAGPSAGGAQSTSGALSGGSSAHSASTSSSTTSARAAVGSSGAGSTAKSPPKKPSPGSAGPGIPPPALPSVPSAPDPGSVLPPVDVPSAPGLPPVPPLPPLPPPPPLPAPPVIATPDNLVAEATGPIGAAVAYTVTASDAVDGDVPVTCLPASGSTFSLGHTTVDCSSTDEQGNTSRASFDVHVRDTTAPAVTVPADIKVQTALAAGTRVTFTASATDLVDAAPKVGCNPASGSVFLVQTTTVTCTATDSSGNSSSKSFHVTVALVPPLVP